MIIIKQQSYGDMRGAMILDGSARIMRFHTVSPMIMDYG